LLRKKAKKRERGTFDRIDRIDRMGEGEIGRDEG
jgi:hypothetical protein